MKRPPIARATRGPLPDRLESQLAALGRRPPNGADWIHEIKFDGYRMACRIEKGNVSIISRRNLDWTQRFPDLASSGLTKRRRLSLPAIKDARRLA